MKKAYILLASLALLAFFSFTIIFYLKQTSYTPKRLKDAILHTQAQILLQDFKELSKLFLYEAKLQGKDCLESVSLNYPNPNDFIVIRYFYPLGKCENFKLTQLNTDANLSKDKLIIAHINILLNSQKVVNDEIFIQDTFTLYPK
ncbi:hypothetical protein [Campylobacter sp. MIT 97-5078]|uniref:hypothetical protein n=1 Tax=Campylobacter sp. MIT 97-5078 TaxID=1548153 RepID=UPI0005136191|nr:hypothetical protein [Campylobacter sp. MIT 97-5078]KGI56489.1 hypothetical protein LR59_07210 [Campylobacter sp. MIT 97-5078]TQR27991.1 hypothetical protein DMB91_01800 [Campylobacter sp. MIT 97-5078]